MNNKHEHSLKVQDYTIFFSQNYDAVHHWLQSKNYSNIFVLTDENTQRDCLPLITSFKKYFSFTIPAGEQYKNLETCQKIWNFLHEKKADRKGLLILLGGGVTTDMGAFCAATYKRGIDFINIPTSLLAQVDATVGGKTGIDFKYQKNMLGLFANPRAIFVNTQFLKTLPEKEIKSGYGEMLKHGLLSNENYWKKLITNENEYDALILESVEFKKSIVERDPFEKGERKILNFGHTIGHALESYFLQKKNSVSHGESVAWGMIAELWLSHQLLNFDLDKMNYLVNEIARRYPLKNGLNANDFTTIITFMQGDKKNEQSKILAVLLEEIGKPKIDISLSESNIKESLNFLHKIYKK